MVIKGGKNYQFLYMVKCGKNDKKWDICNIQITKFNEHN